MDSSQKLMKVSSNPHIRGTMTTQKIMLIVIAGLMPTTLFGIYWFGLKALWVILASVVSAVLSELIFNLITKSKVTVGDLSAVVTGLLLALNLPATVPIWLPCIGAVFAIMVVKMLFGGLGQNFMNPALAARCFLLISFPKLMTDFSFDGFSGATPLAELKSGKLSYLVNDMILGRIPGTIGETSMVAIVLGACILIIFGVIDLYVCGTYIVAFAAFILIFAGHGVDLKFLCAHLSGGGLMLGAFFMATDYVTRPVTKKGQVIYGIFLGFLTAIFRIFAPSSEGVSYAIIIGNLLVPLIEKITMPIPFGVKKGGNK